jgi:hypothetical protein
LQPEFLLSSPANTLSISAFSVTGWYDGRFDYGPKLSVSWLRYHDERGGRKASAASDCHGGAGRSRGAKQTRRPTRGNL